MSSCRKKNASKNEDKNIIEDKYIIIAEFPIIGGTALFFHRDLSEEEDILVRIEQLSREREDLQQDESSSREFSPGIKYSIDQGFEQSFAKNFKQCCDRRFGQSYRESFNQSNKQSIDQKTDLYPGCQKALKQLQEYLEGKRKNFTLTYQAGGSDFAREVYHELCQVEYGSTVSYGKLAERAGHPRAARAVGQALNKNPLPLVVPCHRVITAGGEIGGFGLGKRIKSRLLELESWNSDSR